MSPNTQCQYCGTENANIVSAWKQYPHGGWMQGAVWLCNRCRLEFEDDKNPVYKLRPDFKQELKIAS